MAKIKLRKAYPSDRADLQKISREAYTQNFGDHWEENGLEMFLEGQFNDHRLERELRGIDQEYYFIMMDDHDIGFVKINFKGRIEDLDEPQTELEKIYILPRFKGVGIGSRILKQIIDLCHLRGSERIWLNVIDTNTHAIGFYRKFGFQLHSMTRLDLPLFKDELRGMHLMVLDV